MKALVLGCGPAGLLATHALYLNGIVADIVSRKEPSFIAGAQYLHSAIPELTFEYPEKEVAYRKIGTAEGYALKIYGAPGMNTSWLRYEEGVHPAWPLEQYYHRLWDLYRDQIYDGDFTDRALELALLEYDLVVSSIPLKILFPQASYESESIYVVPEPPYAHDTELENIIVYNGEARTPWYRHSYLWGTGSVEYPATYTAARYFPGSRMITKPLRSTALNPYENLVLVGRYGKWEKGQLVDDAFRDAMKIGENLR
jgi:hypothetical protein